MLLLLTSSHVSAGSARPARLVSSLPARLRCESVMGSSWQPPRCTAFSHHHRQVASQCPDDMRWGVTAQHGAPGLPCTQHCGLYTPVCDAAADLYASLLGQVGSLWQTKQAAYDIWHPLLPQFRQRPPCMHAVILPVTLPAQRPLYICPASVATGRAAQAMLRVQSKRRPALAAGRAAGRAAGPGCAGRGSPRGGGCTPTAASRRRAGTAGVLARARRRAAAPRQLR